MVIMSKLLLAAVATGKKGPMAVPVALLRTVKRSSCFRISCGTHNPSDDAHPGEYLPLSDRTYSSQASHAWTCCGGTWRLGHCSVLAKAFEAVAFEIPVSEAQRERLAAKERAAEEAWRERERQEASAMANDNYSWDRS